MNYLLVIVLLLFGFFCAFLTAVLTYLSQEQINIYLESDPKKAAKLQQVKVQFDKILNSFFLFEMIAYIISVLILGKITFFIYYNFTILVIAGVLLFLVVLLVRTISYAVGRRTSSKAALKLTSIILILTKLSSPAIRVLNFIDLKIRGKAKEEASREELSAMFESARDEGTLDADEYRILKNIMKFNTVLVSDVMTPRTVILSFKANTQVGDIAKMPELITYSRFPIWENDSLDNGVIGYVMSKDILHAALTGKTSMKLKDFSREVYFIPENAELDNALDEFLKRRQHLFVVVDEYGGVEGLITMEDVLETILGVEIVDEKDKIIDLRDYAKQKRDERVASKIVAAKI